MKTQLSESFRYYRNDAFAGIVTGAMAVPLTVGICLMSDYPVMIGLYTVIFAGIISFITYLFKPGNYTGMPGVAAGLAPALALGVQYFGMENMPFVIVLTSLFQVIVWRYRLERYILQIVPHYLVEGLLAGVGLKIALKFVPFLYDIEHETATWLNLEREVILILSIVSFVSFVHLYRYYQKKMPAMPYFVIMASATLLSFFLPLPMLSVDQVPFQLSIPLLNTEGLSNPELMILIIKMVGFAIMLGTIDVIEQVMSNVAIEKIDPLSRKANTNNSLLAIWIANLGSSFFGGMTNLDGLAKSTTNTVAGAKTKLSNLFTSLVLLLVVLFPFILDYVPEYALGVIMVYSGWKMIANIANVRTEGRYALIMAGICAILVFEMGIFEGLLILLFGHAIIQYIFMRRVGRSTVEIITSFKDTFSLRENPSLQLEDSIQEPLLPLLEKWSMSVNQHDIDAVMKLYNEESLLIPAFSTRIRSNKDQIKDLYRDLFQKDGLFVTLKDVSTQKVDGLKVDSGTYLMDWVNRGFRVHNELRFSIVIKNGLVVSHHDSIVPKDEVTVSNPAVYQDQYID